MKLEQAIKSTTFRNEIHKAGLNILYTAWWLKTLMSKELKEYGLTHEQYNVLRILKGNMIKLKRIIYLTLIFFLATLLVLVSEGYYRWLVRFLYEYFI